MITLEEARTDYPSVFAPHADSEVSKRYTFVSTEKLINNFQQLGMEIHDVKVPKVRKADANFSKHMVRMNITDKSLQEVGEELPQLLIINSHNRSCGLTLQLGIFRLVCSNGLIIADSTISKFYQKHIQLDIDSAYTIMRQAVSEFKNVFEKTQSYKEIFLSENQRRSFANEALGMIYNERAGMYEVDQFLNARRLEDEEPTLYNTYNTVQENYMKGGNTYHTKKGEKRSKAINSISNDLNSNMILWGLMDKYYQQLRG